MITVFQTQAHQKSHTFHHFSIGQIRSTTFIQVSNTSVWVDKSWNSGDFLWIGQCSFVLGASISSIGSHNTLNILHRTFSHTGTDIGFQVGTTSSHLLTHSTGFIAIVLTMLSHSCCCTSSISFSGAHLTSSASYIFGMYNSANSTSITTHMIFVIFQFFMDFLIFK